jgi:hypothetical protein
MKKSEALRIAQRCVLCWLKVETLEEQDMVIDVLAVLKKEEETARHIEGMGDIL